MQDEAGPNGRLQRRLQRPGRNTRRRVEKERSPVLAEIETTPRLRSSPVPGKGFGAGFESMTNGFTNRFLNKRKELFAGACPYVSSFWLMHMVEETEHKTVAFDAYMAYSGAYLPRAIGVFHGSLHVLGYGFIGMFAALKQDRALGRAATWLEIARETASVVTNVRVAAALLRLAQPAWRRPTRSGCWTRSAQMRGSSSTPCRWSIPRTPICRYRSRAPLPTRLNTLATPCRLRQPATLAAPRYWRYSAWNDCNGS